VHSGHSLVPEDCRRLGGARQQGLYALGGAFKARLEYAWRNVKYTIINEISMISNKLLGNVHERLTVRRGSVTPIKARPRKLCDCLCMPL
jgi:hypothetical protein